MSILSNDKAKMDSVSLDGEDSGHDSVDDPQSALEDRERINHLETAVAWIRGEVVSSEYKQLVGCAVLHHSTAAGA